MVTIGKSTDEKEVSFGGGGGRGGWRIHFGKEAFLGLNPYIWPLC